MIGRPSTRRTVFLTTGLSRHDGGPFLSVSGLARGVASLGERDVAVLGIYRSVADWDEDRRQWEGLRVEAAGVRRFRAVDYLSGRLARHLRTGPAGTVIHLQGLWDSASLAVERVRGRRRAALVISPRGMLEPWALKHHARRKRVGMFLWQRRQLVQADLLHATSVDEYVSFRRLGLRNPICVIPNGVEVPEPHEVDSGDAIPGAARASAGTENGSAGESVRRCLFLSRLHAKKGLPMLLEAWARVRPRGWVLEIAGAGNDGYDREISRLISSRGLGDVSLVGELAGEAKWRFLSRGELFVLPSYSENFGIAVAEAMGMGLPVITTTATPWSVLQSQRCGWWVEPAADGIARAIAEATAETREQLAARGRRGREHVRNHFRWEAIARRMDACYAWVTGEGDLPEDVRLD